ncbi:lipopolysaccharide transport system permease protein [Pseudomonas antarctica]|uniref:ABC-2 type transporter n=1 Tax=Pseudomonas antarctica TaxID=219572 RepID=A0A1G9YKH3_9PSED|nr:ABC transporter permease [Pseudomonas antarctica]KAF2410645.1 ABC-2 type transporter [Pseudomonas antarctica]SDN09749.1 lipopolysaccharide transport system permease protein [Pseudomonas antarctica]
MREGISDLVAAISRRDIWLYFAISDTKARYARSTLGPWWITLGTALGVVGLGLVWSAVMSVDLHVMLPNLAVGLVLWFMISGVISESSNGFTNQAAIIRNYPLPLSLHTLRLLSKHIINFGHNISIVLVVFCIYGFPSLINAGWALLGLLLVILNLWWISLLVSTLGARFRDLGPSIDALMPILFFLTPILYKKSDVVSAAAWFDYNPIATLFSLVKNPLLSLPVHSLDYASMAVFSVVGWTLALAVFGRHKKHIVFWI